MKNTFIPHLTNTKTIGNGRLLGIKCPFPFVRSFTFFLLLVYSVATNPHNCESIDWNGRHLIEFIGCGDRFANQLHDALRLPKPTNDTFIVGFSSGCASATSLCVINRTKYASDLYHALNDVHDFPSLAASVVEIIRNTDFDENCLQNHFACIVTPKYELWKMVVYWASGKRLSSFRTLPCWRRPHNAEELMQIVSESTDIPFVLPVRDDFIEGWFAYALLNVTYDDASSVTSYSGCPTPRGTTLLDVAVPSLFHKQILKAQQVLQDFLHQESGGQE